MNGNEFHQQKFAVAGLGVSGIAAAKALDKAGARVTVFDQRPSDHPSVVAATDDLQRHDIDVVAGWHGRLDSKEFDVLIVSPGFRRDHPAILDMKGKPVISEVELAYRLSKAPILAITGTNGKSTTTVLLWTILKAAGKKARLCGNIAGSGYPEEALTTAALNAEDDEILVAEISSYQLEFVEQFRPKVATVTNVTPDHFDRHPNFEDYYRTKMRIFDQMGAGDFIVVNQDEPSLNLSDLEPAKQRGVKLIEFSTSKDEDNSKLHGDTLTLGAHKIALKELKVFGAHNITNIAAAWEMAACVAELGESSIQALKDFPGLDNRLEFIGTYGGVNIINNSMCTNPAAVIASSRAIAGKQHLLMGGNTKGLDFAPVAEYLKTTPHQIYLFGQNQENLKEMLGVTANVYNDLQSAFEAALDAATSGESVILSPGCASSEPYANFKERGLAFKKIAKDRLNDGTKDWS